MKVAISCDQLIERTHVTEIVELLAELFPEAEIYTLAHRPKAILGTLELRKIHSTFLSHKAKTLADLARLKYLVPSAAKNLYISCRYDLIINVSSGLSHGLRKCNDTKMLTYFYRDEFIRSDKPGLLDKFFYSYVKSWSQKQLAKADKVFFSSPSLQKEFSKHCAQSEIIPPSFKLDDFKLFPEGMFAHDYVLINADGLDQQRAREIKSIVERMNLNFRFIGKDDHLADLKNAHPEQFIGVKCHGELAPLFAGSLFFIDLGPERFPADPLCALATGRPVVVANNPTNKETLTGEGVIFLDQGKISQYTVILEKFLDQAKSYSGERLRAPTFKFNQLKFKHKIKREIENMLSLS